MPPLKEGRRSAGRRTTGFRPAAERKACQRMRRALYSPPAPHCRGIKERRARLSALHRGTTPRDLSLDSAPGRASWNHRIQTGGPSPAPVQPAPGSPVTRRTVDAQSRPDAGYKPASGNRTRPTIGCHRSTSLRWARSALCNDNGDGCQECLVNRDTAVPVIPRSRASGNHLHFGILGHPPSPFTDDNRTVDTKDGAKREIIPPPP